MSIVTFRNLPSELAALERDMDAPGAHDVAAVDRTSGRLLLAECKWTNRPLSVDVVRALLAKRELVEGRWKEVRLAVFSKSGFTEQCEREAEDLLLIDLDRIRSLCERE
jgi:hypothetical protein